MFDAYRLEMTISGKAPDAESRFEVINPATGAVFATAPQCSETQLNEAFESARGAQVAWASDSEPRRESLRAMATAVASAADDLARLLVQEVGRPLAQAHGEILAVVQLLGAAADIELAHEIAWETDTEIAEIVRRPLGVVAAISPWNYPVALSMTKVAAALRTGNTVVLKPSPYTPLTILAIGEVLRAVLPQGVFNVVSGLDPLGALMTAHPVPRKISFTGSTATGRLVGQSAMKDLKRVTLELGGNDAAIVLADADPAVVGPQIAYMAFANCGQVCVAIKRVYVASEIYSDFVASVSAFATSLVIGNGLDEGAQMGPLQNKAQFDRVRELVDDAIHNGATVAAGGSAIDGPGYFHQATVLTDVDDTFRVVAEEQFGPVLPIMSFTTEDEAIERANNTMFGLTASVWGRDHERLRDVAARLDAGITSVNRHAIRDFVSMPLSGHKWSGVGSEFGRWGIVDYTDLQVVVGPKPASN